MITKQDSVIKGLNVQHAKLEDENKGLIDEEADLQVKISAAKKENQEKKTKNKKLLAESRTLAHRVEITEDNIDKLIATNVEHFDQYQEIIHTNNENIDKMRADLGHV